MPRCTLYALQDQPTPSTNARCSLARGSPARKIDRRSRWRQGDMSPSGIRQFRVGRPIAAPPILEEFNFAPNPTDAFAAPFSYAARIFAHSPNVPNYGNPFRWGPRPR
jgi:hypothetical protein